jgi:hypothetical protein
LDFLSSIIRMTKSRRIKLAGHVARLEAKRVAYKRLVGKPEEKRPLGRPRHSWVDNIVTCFLLTRLIIYGLRILCSIHWLYR